jgi:hypothetical protein
MKYGIIFQFHSANRKMIFTLQKKTVRIITGVKSRNSCRNLFIRLEIVPLPCAYIFTFFVNNQGYFHTNSAIHIINTRSRKHLYRPSVILSKFVKICIICWFKDFQQSPISLVSLKNKKLLCKAALKGT